MIELASSGAARFVPIDTEKNLVKSGGNPEAVFLQGMMAPRRRQRRPTIHIFLGYVEGTPYFAVDVTGKDVPLKELGEFVDLRQVGALLFAREGSILAYARGMTYWHRRHRYCGVCGATTKVTRGGHVRRCTNESCKTEHFPRTDPAVIMLVHHGDKCLLGRSPHFPRGMHSTLAGFVEPGESFEDAVAREVYEEVKVRVKNVTYRSSQPWPFPASVMIGFHAEAESLDFDVNKSELESRALAEPRGAQAREPAQGRLVLHAAPRFHRPPPDRGMARPRGRPVDQRLAAFAYQRTIMTAQLFTPVELGGVTLPNRIVVSPMCQYSAVDGSAQPWHQVHYGMLAMSGAGLLCLEATHVERDGRITQGCLGLYSDENEAALKPIVDWARAWMPTVKLGIQLAHAGRKASAQRPWKGGGPLTPGRRARPAVDHRLGLGASPTTPSGTRRSRSTRSA